MQTPRSDIERQVMASVGVIYAGRQLLSAAAIKLYVCAAAAWGLVQLVWVHRVFENWQQVGLGGTWRFLTYALLHTSLPVQLTLLVLAVAAVSLVRDLFRGLSGPRLAY